MSTRTELHEAYTHLAATAPTRQMLTVGQPRQGRHRVHVALVAIATLTFLVVPAALLQHHFSSGTHQSSGAPGTVASGPPNSTVGFSTTAWFGPASLSGYTETQNQLDPESSGATYTANSTPSGMTPRVVTVSTYVSTATTDATYSHGKAVKIGTIDGYYAGQPTPSNQRPFQRPFGLAWKFKPTMWVVLDLSESTKVGTNVVMSEPDAATLVAVAKKLKPSRPDDNLALVKVGYLPASLRFDYVATFLNQTQMLSPDGTVGTGYRIMSFVDRKAVAQRGGSVSAVNHSTLDIVTVAQPSVPMAQQTLATLPGFDGFDGPWTRTTVAGHPAWASPHDILIQWGSIQIGVASSRVAGDNTTPLLPQSTLLKIANSLTEPAGVTIGAGYPLISAVPAGRLR